MKKALTLRPLAKLLPLALVLPTQLYAAIAQSPLYITTAVKPNLFFLVDDSGSMDWEVLKSSGAQAIAAYSSYANSGTIDITPTRADPDEILESCAGYNVLYYDPNTTYVPWEGVDNAGNPYGNQSITAARLNPYEVGGGTRDLTAPDENGDLPGYMVWTDDGDGVFEAGECPNPSAAGYDYVNQFVATVAGGGPVNVMSAAQQTNFANWFTYYRKREYLVKAAMQRIATASEIRLGLGTLQRNNSVGFPVADMQAGTNRSSLMSQISRIDSSGDTPLRTKLAEVGEYFRGNGGATLFGSAQSSPIQTAANGGECQQNFAIVMSDGYWNGATPSVGNADSGSVADGDLNDSSYDGGNYRDQYTGVANTLADVAMYYYETDLSNLPNNVPGSPEDGNPQQHLVTYGVAFGVNGTLSANPDPGATQFNWPTPVADQITTIDDMRHAAWNGRGEFLSAGDPLGLINSLDNAVASIESRTSSAAAVATNSTRLDANSKIYQARFRSSDWSGQFRAYALDATTGDVSALQWDAAELVPSHNLRNIFSSNGSSGFAFNTTSWDAGLFSAAQMTALNTVGGTADGRGRDRVNFLRGDATNEGTLFRSRSRKLGDIVNSDPVFTHRENFDYYGVESSVTIDDVPIDSYYLYLSNASVATNKATREAMLYVGANDGMLHGIRASGTIGASIDSPCAPDFADCEGEEAFAYIPKALYSKLSSLSSPDYFHTYYVDGSVRIADAFIDYKDAGTASAARWGTVLVGLLGGGGAGVYALDVSNPLNFGARDVLWDLDRTNLPQLGYTFGNAAVAKLPDGTWAAIIGNGYESANHKAGLYIINLQNPSDVVFIDTGFNGTAVAPNGLSSPLVVDNNGDNLADTVYAGDLYGNLWKFDLSSSNRNSWGIPFKSGSTPKPLYRACADVACTQPQPITARPEAAAHSGGGTMVLFGTGRYLSTGDISNTALQTFYGIRDRGSMVANRDSLQRQSILAEVYVSDSGTDYRITSNTGVDYTVKKGWFLDLNSANYPGERVVANPLVRGGRIIFTTLTPDENPCKFGGSGWLMELDAINGARLEESPFDVNADSALNANDFVTVTVTQDGVSIEVRVPVSGRKSTVGVVKTPAVISAGTKEVKYFSGSSGNIEKVFESSGQKLGRHSWMQIR